MTMEEFIKRLYSQKYILNFKSKIMLLGIKNKLKPYNVIIFKFISANLLFFIVLFSHNYGYILAPVTLIIYLALFNYFVIDKRIKKRTIEIENEAMHFFEVLTLSLETGRNLIEAIDVTTTNVSGILSIEFQEAIREVKYGKSLNEALIDMQKRIPSDTVNIIILSLTQANLYGNSIVENLYGQVDYLRTKRKMMVKGKISKVPVYISIISVLFFIPLILLIILGPIILNYIK